MSLNAQRLMFVHVPKTGGWAVKKALRDSGAYYYSLRHRGKAKKPLSRRMVLGSSGYRALKVFTVFRNPFTRAVSAFNYLKHGGERHRANDVRDFNNHLAHFSSFESFVLEGGLAEASKHLVHFRTQCFWLRATNAQTTPSLWDIVPNVDILKYEKMKKVVPTYIKKYTGASVGLKKINGTHHKDELTNIQQVRSEVYKVYQQDYSLWKSL